MAKIKSRWGVLAQYLKNPYIETSLMAIIYLQFSSIVLEYFSKTYLVLSCWLIISAIIIIGYWEFRQIAYSNKNSKN